MMNQLTFSIITVSFNSEKTIERTIQSVLKQTYPYVEYIIVDGASKDGTLDIVKRYEPMFEGRMKWKSEPDNGIYDAMNKGIRIATGDIIGIVNSDDWLEQDALQTVFESYCQNNFSLDCIYTGGIRFHGKRKVKDMMPDLSLMKKMSTLYFMGGIKHPATFVTRNVYDKMGQYDEMQKLSADTDFILRCYFYGVNFITISKVLSNMSEGGISTNLTMKSFKIGYEDYKIRLEQYKISSIKLSLLKLRYICVGTIKILKGRLLHIN